MSGGYKSIVIKIAIMSEDKNENYSLEIYKIAFERLQFQDDYIFKFSALFVTFNGALGYAWKKVFISNISHQFDFFLYLLATFGFVVCFIWYLWTKHNDYWHAVWIGCLINIENEILGETSNLGVFSANHPKIAAAGGRCEPFFKGHVIGSLLPITTGVCWLLVLVYFTKCN